ncbi:MULTISPECIES: alkaline phosphatase [Methylococcus]|uniref:Alkaline phosphatase family protein n=2 Tax=Methylococcus capsulatus TaxID=414 RepID=Q605T9_METCA|nr:alkaline phosphatase [Methylococcus capsulatus]AAU91582.1 alkaline phosphatase family protein [Methylococcus capsulatus str. Bath]QXP91434.1 alkaline phosphatase [Methylococcus capsulatus]CAI8846922.1 alkaline phosphatase [Methylococcus capsulatus]
MRDDKSLNRMSLTALAAASAISAGVEAAPTISRLTPPSELFRTGSADPIVSRFVVGQKFDLQATVRPDTGKTITSVVFKVDGQIVATVTPSTGGKTSMVPATAITDVSPNAVAASVRGYSNSRAGIRTLTVTATQSDDKTVTATGNFEIVPLTWGGVKVKNVIIMLGDGMGAGHRAAARIMQYGVAQGKVKGRLAMDTFPVTASIMTASLNSIVTDSAPGMQNYVTGNKANNNQEGVFPDDTTANFDNPRVEYLSEFLARGQGKKLGIVTTADVFDATPASMAVHTQNRGAGTGIVDQFFDDRANTGLTVLMGGGRKWFLPNPTTCNGGAPVCGDAGGVANFNGSARSNGSDYVLPADIVAGWGAAPGALDPGRDLIADFQAAGWNYVYDSASLSAAGANRPLLGLFSLSNMNVALDKLGKRRGTSTVVDDYGFPDQPMLEEMTEKALQVLDANSPRGFVLMVEGASIDKQAHNMDTERFILDTIEFDKSVAVAKEYARTHPGTLVLVTADHECAGVAVIGGSRVTDDELQARIAKGEGATQVRNGVVGTYEAAGFPHYPISGTDGYPSDTDPDKKMLIGYAANADRYEDWRTNAQPLRDSQQPGNAVAPLNAYPGSPMERDTAGNFLVTGQIADAVAAHTGNDVPLSACGRGASLMGGTMDNTDVFFQLVQATVGGVAPGSMATTSCK